MQAAVGQQALVSEFGAQPLELVLVVEALSPTIRRMAEWQPLQDGPRYWTAGGEILSVTRRLGVDVVA
jgi:hypothetical protein